MQQNEKKFISLTVAEIKKNLTVELSTSGTTAEKMSGKDTFGWLHNYGIFSDREFIDRAYRLILNREPDPDGLDNYSKKLATTQTSRPEIIVALRLSGEGRRCKKKIPGFYKVLFRALWCRTPVVGYVIRLCLKTTSFQAKQNHLQKQLDEFALLNLELNTKLVLLSERLENSEKEKKVDPKLYHAFENEFRGKESSIKKNLEVYLPFIENSKLPFTNYGESCRHGFAGLDLGCGRGEWLELLGERDFSAVGIDCSPTAVRACGERGLNAELGDALLYIKSRAESSFNFVTAFHLFEHLPLAKMLEMIREINRVLVPGGCLILETPNPTNILVSSYDFYRDPTHENPLHPETLVFFAEYFKFDKVVGYFVNHETPKASTLNPISDWRLDSLDDYLKAPRDFAMVGIRN